MWPIMFNRLVVIDMSIFLRWYSVLSNSLAASSPNTAFKTFRGFVFPPYLVSRSHSRTTWHFITLTVISQNTDNRYSNVITHHYLLCNHRVLSIPFALSFSTYSDSEKDNLRAFLRLLANATYGTFSNVFEDSRIQPKDYLNVLNSLRTDISYAISNSHLEIFFPYSLIPTITELGSCYSYNGEIASYNSYEWVNIRKIMIQTKRTSR